MRFVVRILAFLGKEVFEVLRQPRLLLVVVIGPFLILLLFGSGLRDGDPPLDAVLVAPPDQDLSAEVEQFEQTQDGQLTVQDITEDEEVALDDLRGSAVDVVIVFPEQVSETLQQNEHPVITVYHQQLDPLESQAISLYVETAVARVNDQVTAQTVEEAQDALAQADPPADSDLEGLTEASPELIASPFEGQVALAEGEQIPLAAYYAPAVAIVLLQHLLVTLMAVSLVRESELGTAELYRAAPLRTWEIVVGKYLAFGLIAALVGAVLLAAMGYGLGVPLLGQPEELVVVLALSCISSAGLGLCVAGLARNHSQAVQYTMLVLLATVFLSGFVLSLERFLPFLSWLALALPPTHAISVVREIMLQGTSPGVVPVVILSGGGGPRLRGSRALSEAPRTR